MTPNERYHAIHGLFFSFLMAWIFFGVIVAPIVAILTGNALLALVVWLGGVFLIAGAKFVWDS